MEVLEWLDALFRCDDSTSGALVAGLGAYRPLPDVIFWLQRSRDFFRDRVELRWF